MNILIIKPSSLGDIILGLQVAQSIKEQLPNCHIDWVVRDRFAPIVTQCNTIDRVFLFQRGKGLKPFIQLLKSIRETEYDYVLDFQGLARSGVMTFFAHGLQKLGRSDSRELSSLAYYQTVPLPPSGKMSHAADILLQFLPQMGLKPVLLGKLSYKTHSLTPIDPRLTPNNHPIVIIPTSRQPKKEWQKFAELTQKILDHYPSQTVVWDSHVTISAPEFESNSNFINTTGKTTIEDMISLIAQARLVIANDSGPMHLAAAMEKPVLGIFGPTPAQRFGPYPLSRKTNHIIEAPDGDLSALTADAVFAAVDKILK